MGRLRRQLVVLAIGLVVAACGGSAPSSSSQTRQFSPILLGLSSDPTSLTPVVAVDKGFFQKYGIQAQYRLMNSGGDAVTAVVAGDVESAGTLSEMTTLGTRAKGGNIKILAVVDRTGKQVGLVGNKDIHSAQDLVGKTVGATFGQGNQLFGLLYLKKHGIDASKVKFVNVQPADTVAALARGDIQAFFSFQPWLEKAGPAVPGAHIVAYSGDDNVYFLTLTVVATSAWLKANPDEAVAMMKALKDATTWINGHHADAVQEVSSVYHLDAASAKSIFDIQQYVFDSPDTIKPLWNSAASFMNDNKIATIPSPSSFVDALIDDQPYKTATGSK